MTSKKTTRTYCAQCFSNCPVKAETEDGKLVKVMPDSDHLYYRPLCPKGTAAPEIVNSPDRLKMPMKRTNPKGSADPGWQEISWEEALNTVADKMKSIREEHGAEALAFSQTNVSSPVWEITAFVRRLANLYGTPNHITTTYICNWHRDNASALTFGKPGDSFAAGWPDMEHSKCIIIWGFNPRASMNAYHWKLNFLNKNDDVKVIVIDPRKTSIADKADSWLRVKPGTDGALALGMINYMISNNLYDKNFVSEWTNAPLLVRRDTGNLLRAEEVYKDSETPESFFTIEASFGNLRIHSPGDKTDSAHELDKELEVTLADGAKVKCATSFRLLKESVKSYTPEYVEKVTSITPSELSATVELISENSPACWYSFNGTEQTINATQTNRAICTFYAMTGDYDKKGGNVLCSPIPHLDYPFGFEFVTPEMFRKNIALQDHPMGPAGTLLSIPPSVLCRSIEESAPYKIRGLITFGTNMLLSNPNSQRIADAIKQLDFYVHTDLFMNQTAQLADIVLPAASFWEVGRIGYPMSFKTSDNILQWRESVAEPQGESKDDIWIIFQLAERLGYSDKFWDGDLDEAFEQMLKPSGYSLEELKKIEGGTLIKNPAVYQKYKAGGFDNMTGRVEIFSQHLKNIGQPAIAEWRNPLEVFEKSGIDISKYPLTLTNAKIREFCQSQHRNIPSLRKMQPEPFIEINREKAESLDIANGETVILETAKGEIRLIAKLSDKVAPDVVCTQHGWGEGCSELDLPGQDVYSAKGSNVNLIYTDSVSDPVSGSIQMRGFPCNVKKLTD